MARPRPERRGRPAEYGERVNTQVRLPRKLHQRLKREAAERGVSVNRLIIMSIESFFTSK